MRLRALLAAMLTSSLTHMVSAQPAANGAPAPLPPGPAAGTPAATSPLARAQDARDPALRAPVAAPPVLLSVPPTLKLEMYYHPDRPIPPGYRVFKEPNKAFIVPGAVALGALWLVAVVQSESAGTSSGPRPMVIPLVGPFITLGTWGVPQGSQALFALEGVGQWLGLGAIVTGFFVPWRVLKFQFRQGPEVTLQPALAPIAGGMHSALSFSF